MHPRDTSGRLLRRPAARGALVALVVNDHVLKRAFPGFVTGKLSDVAGLVLLPIVGAVVVDGARGTRSRGNITIAAIVSAAGFAAVKLWRPAAEAYGIAVGALRWIAVCAAALACHRSLPGLAVVAVAHDPSDLLALPAVLVPIALARQESAMNAAPVEKGSHSKRRRKPRAVRGTSNTSTPRRASFGSTSPSGGPGLTPDHSTSSPS